MGRRGGDRGRERAAMGGGVGGAQPVGRGTRAGGGQADGRRKEEQEDGEEGGRERRRRGRAGELGEQGTSSCATRTMGSELRENRRSTAGGGAGEREPEQGRLGRGLPE